MKWLWRISKYILLFVIPSFHENLWNEFAESYIFKCIVNDIARCQDLNSCNMCPLTVLANKTSHRTNTLWMVWKRLLFFTRKQSHFFITDSQHFNNCHIYHRITRQRWRDSIIILLSDLLQLMTTEHLVILSGIPT